MSRGPVCLKLQPLAERMVSPRLEGTWLFSGAQQRDAEENMARWVESVALQPSPQRQVSGLCWLMGQLP